MMYLKKEFKTITKKIFFKFLNFKNISAVIIEILLYIGPLDLITISERDC